MLNAKQKRPYKYYAITLILLTISVTTLVIVITSTSKEVHPPPVIDCPILASPHSLVNGIVSCEMINGTNKCSVTCLGKNNATKTFSCEKKKSSEMHGFVGCSSIDLVCRSLPKVDHGTIKCDDLSYGSSCSLTCNKGYFGSDKATCIKKHNSSGAAWDKNLTCTEIFCKAANKPIHAKNGCGRTKYKSKCDVECMEGFSGSKTLTCEGGSRGSGEWDSEVSCKPVTCPKVLYRDNTTNSCPVSTYNSTCNVSCGSGYYGSKTITCREGNGTVGAWSSLETCQPCKEVSLVFPRAKTIQDYAKVQQTFPPLNQATVCSWLDFTANGKVNGSAISYATRNCSNSLLVDDVYMGFNCRTFIYPSIATKRSHLCVTFNATYKKEVHITTYVNGTFKWSETLLGWLVDFPVDSNGILVLGQDQDDPYDNIPSTFSAKQSYYGTIGNFAMWDRVLAPKEVQAVYQGNVSPADAVVAVTNCNVELFGNATAVPYKDG